MTISIGSTSFVFHNGIWNLSIVEKSSHHRAKDDLHYEENHGSLNRAIAALATYKHYDITKQDDIDMLNTLYRVYKNALIEFKTNCQFPVEKTVFTVYSQAIPKASYIGFTDNHGVGLYYEQTTTHKRSESGISVECTYPGNFYQVCEKILDIEVGERMLKATNPTVSTLIDAIDSTTKDILSGLKERKELNPEIRKSFRLCAAQNIRVIDMAQKNSNVFEGI